MTQIRRSSDISPFLNAKKRLMMTAKRASYASLYHERRLKGKHPLRLLGTPEDPWAGSVAIGAYIMSNRFSCAGQILTNADPAFQAEDIWLEKDLNATWGHYLHSFCWLRDLNRVVDRKGARQKAMAISSRWLEEFDRWHALAWAPDIIGQRLINWMAYAPLILDSTDLIFRSKLLNSLARQARHLNYVGDDNLRGLARMQAISGLILAGLYVPYGEAWLKKGTELLTAALAQEILPDGGVSSRNPEDITHMLRDFLRVRLSYQTRGHPVPQPLNKAIKTMIPLLKNLLHGDGKLALFNGASEENAQDIAAIFSYADQDTKDTPDIAAQESGIRRLCQGSLRAFMDVGPPPEEEVSQQGHAGALSFELSDGPQRIIVNCGAAHSLPDLPDTDLHRLSRSTAAHSTVILNDTNSSEIRKDGFIGAGPTMVSCHETSVGGHRLLEASHDGYVAQFGVSHHRTLYMNDLGNDVRGEDILALKNKTGQRRSFLPHYDVRFHLHPDITVIRQDARDRVLLRLPAGQYWQFQFSGGQLSLEESLYLGERPKLQKCRQIVLSGRAERPKTVIKWALHRLEQNK